MFVCVVMIELNHIFFRYDLIAHAIVSLIIHYEYTAIYLYNYFIIACFVQLCVCVLVSVVVITLQPSNAM
jgi:hypothetical protein